MRYFLLLVIICGCDPEPSVLCSYCHVLREGAKRYVCDKCSTPHVACDVDKAVMHYNQTGSGRLGAIYHSATSVLVCPSPEDPKQKGAIEAAPEKDGSGSIAFVTMIAVIFSLILSCQFYYCRKMVTVRKDQEDVE